MRNDLFFTSFAYTTTPGVFVVGADVAPTAATSVSVAFATSLVFGATFLGAAFLGAAFFAGAFLTGFFFVAMLDTLVHPWSILAEVANWDSVVCGDIRLQRTY